MVTLGIDYEFFNSFCKSTLAKDKSIRWVGVVNKNGVILTQKTREGTKLLLTEEENEEYASSAIARQKTRGKLKAEKQQVRLSMKKRSGGTGQSPF